MLEIVYLDKTETVVIPGNVLPQAGDGHLRISIGPLTSEDVGQVFDRLKDFFDDY